MNIEARIQKFFLSENGVELDNNPNAKLLPDVYQMLLEEFQSEKMVKEESQLLTADIKEKESITIGENSTDEEATKEIPIKEEPTIAEEVIKAKPKTDISLKVVGKVEVKEKTPKKKEEKKPEEPKAKEPKKAEEKVEEKAEEKVEEKVEEKAEEKVEEKEIKEVAEKKEENKDTLIEAKPEKLTGPKVIGSIKLPVEAPKKKLLEGGLI